MDNRKDYSRFKITIIELWFRFEYFGRETFINRMGISAKKIDRIIKEWNDNDNCIVVGSRLNNTLITKL